MDHLQRGAKGVPGQSARIGTWGTSMTDPAGSRVVCVTVDAEPDCPPYLGGWRGMEEGAPAVLDLFAEEAVPATFFTTGETAREYPDFVERLVADGHELGSHGMTHTPFPDLTTEEAEREIRETSVLLRTYAPVTSFRAPNLRLPDRYLSLLEEDGYRVDSSRGKYKPAHWRPSGATSMTRLPASVTSSWLRLPTWIRDPMLRRLKSPVVLFVHPWEFIDLSDAPVPWDCRAATGQSALASLRSAVRLYKADGAVFARISDVIHPEEDLGLATPAEGVLPR
jgi:peptidoglycan/xylan/chitin deacetylase (PgdA/CDA1 family)